MAAPYTLFKRNDSGVYYVRFRDRAGRRMTAQSTGCTRKRDAEEWAAAQFRSNGYDRPQKRMSFASYAADWWIPEKCPYIRQRRTEGKSLSSGYVTANRGLLENYILPEFGSMKLDAITRADIEDWKVKLFESGSLAAATVNHALKVLKLMMKEAYRREVIPGNPADLVRNVSGPAKERTALSLNQARALFAERNAWRDLRHYALNLAAFSTGARLGELQALQWQHVHEDYIAITQSWDRQQKRFKEPKWDSRRVIPIPAFTRAILDELRVVSPYTADDDLVFYTANRGSPMDPHEVNKQLRAAMATAELDIDFTFHGWRHTYVSLLRTTVDDTKLMMLTRHKSEALVDRYTHMAIEHFDDVRQSQADWLASG